MLSTLLSYYIQSRVGEGRNDLQTTIYVAYTSSLESVYSHAVWVKSGLFLGLPTYLPTSRVVCRKWEVIAWPPHIEQHTYCPARSLSDLIRSVCCIRTSLILLNKTANSSRKHPLPRLPQLPRTTLGIHRSALTREYNIILFSGKQII